MTLREKLIELVSQLPEERLPAALEQMEQLAGARPGFVEFDLRDQPVRPPRLPLRLPYRTPQVVVETEAPTTEAAALTAAFTRNARWWRDHYAAVLAAHQGVYVAISQGEVFRGDSYLDVLRRAQTAHPADAPFILCLRPYAD